jgi:hypothetical protein
MRKRSRWVDFAGPSNFVSVLESLIIRKSVMDLLAFLWRSKWRIGSVILVNFAASVVMDRGIGLLTGPDVTAGLLFRPHSEALYETTEFTFSASINGLGFRDREFNLGKGANYRIIAIGDSFTYGWGVNLDESWPKVLEKNLRRAGWSLEIANMGSPGAGPANYADTAEKAIPLLRPDLVVIGVLQGDDLAQSKAKPLESGGTSKNSPGRRILLLRMIYPNLTRLAMAAGRKVERNDKKLIVLEWKREAQKMLAQFDEEERQRFSRLDKVIRDAFIGGRLNSDLIRQVIKRPNYYLQTFDLNKPDVQSLIGEMAGQLGRIKRVADRYRARVVVVSVPFGLYVSPAQFKVHRKYGFFVDEKMLGSDSPDQAIRLACEKAGLPFFTTTDRFRDHKTAHFFYDLDGHFNASGYRFYSDQLTPIIMGKILGGRS